MNNMDATLGASYDIIEPNAASLIESLRDIGYTMPTAVADIIDNSLTAGASRISIRAHTDPVDAAIAIIDNGHGMSESELFEAMRPGSKTPTEARSKDDLGRFGLGLKTASFSQCRRLTVVTCKKGLKSVAIWDLDLVVEKNSWIVERRKSDAGIRYAELIKGNGTLILWERLDRVSLELGDQTLLRNLDETSNHLELSFHRFMKPELGKAIVDFDINGRKLVSCDPFCEWHEATIRQPLDRREIEGSAVIIQPFILPHRNKVKSEAEWKRMGLSQGHMRSQGFYLYRNRRLIRHATWFRMAAQNQLTQLARIRIDIGNESDSAWKIDVLKAFASPPPELRNHLRNIIESLSGKSKRVYQKRGAKLTEDNPLPLWQRLKVDSKVNYLLNSEHPSFIKFDDSLTETQSLEFQEFMRLVSAGLPIEALHHDMVGNFEAISHPGLDEAEIISSGRVLIESLRELGHSDREIMKLMNSIPPYMGSMPTIKALIGGDI